MQTSFEPSCICGADDADERYGSTKSGERTCCVGGTPADLALILTRKCLFTRLRPCGKAGKDVIDIDLANYCYVTVLHADGKATPVSV